MRDRDVDTLIESNRQSTGGSIWRPIRRLVPVDDSAHRITRLERAVTPTQSPQRAAPTIAGVPSQLLTITATESPVKQQDRTFSQVSVSFTRDGGDRTYAYTRFYLKGYKGNTDFVLQVDARESPVTFLLETTQETVVVLGVPVGWNGMAAAMELAQTAVVVLDGVISAPPAPSISQSLLTISSGATTIGQQLGFNFLSGVVADVIDGYWIYKVGSHSAPTPPASRFKYVKHTPQSSGTYTFQDVSGVSTNFYYVSAVNKSGLESTLTDSGAGGGAGPVTTVYRPSTQDTSDYTNPSRAYDGNEASYAEGFTTSSALATVWSGFSAIVGSPSAVTLKILSEVSTFDGIAILQYSTNNGSTWTTIYTSASVDHFGPQLDSISLSTGVNLTQVKVAASCSLTDVDGNADHLIYEVRAEVTV